MGSCCSSPAPTSRTCCWRARRRAPASWPSAPRSARRAARWSCRCSPRASCSRWLGGALGLLLAYGAIRALVALNPIQHPPSRGDPHRHTGARCSPRSSRSAPASSSASCPRCTRRAQTCRRGCARAGASNVGDSGAHRASRARGVGNRARARAARVGGTADSQLLAAAAGGSRASIPRNLVTFNISLPAGEVPDRPRSSRRSGTRLSRKLASVPGVTGVAATSTMPFSGNGSTGSFTVENYQPPRGQPGPWGDIRVVNPQFHRAMKIRLISGRYFTDEDRDGSRAVAIVDDEMVRRYWPNTDPIGKRVTFDDNPSAKSAWLEVVGVVEHAAHEGLDAERRVQLYLPYRQRPLPFFSVAVRTAGDPMRSSTRFVRVARGRSRPAALDGANDGRADGRCGRAAPAVDHAADGVRRDRAAACGHRDLRRDVVRRDPADAGDGPADGAGRGAGLGALARRWAGHEAGARRAGDRPGGRDRGRPADRTPVVRDPA